MSSLYNFFLHRKFSSFGLNYLFKYGIILRNAYFATKSYVFSLLMPNKHRFKKIDTAAIKKIVIIRTDRIGDIVLSIPALMLLRKSFPEAEISYIVQKKYAALLNCYSGWDTLFPINNCNNKNEVNRIGNDLLKKQYDLAIVQHPSSYAYTIAKKSECRYVLGWNAKGFGYVCSHPTKDDRAVKNFHQAENNVRLLAPLGIKKLKSPVSYPWHTTQKGENEVKDFIKKYKIVSSKFICAIHPGSFSPRVQWFPEKYAALIDSALSDGILCVILGSGKDKNVLDTVLHSCKNKPIVAYNHFSLEGLVSFLKSVNVFVGNSTGPMHVASSVGTWTIAIFGNQYSLDRYELWKPLGPKGIVIKSDICKKKRCIPWTCKYMECFSDITPQQVLQKINTIRGQEK